MSGEYRNEAVPFVQIGNRQALTWLQIAQEPWLADFVERFPSCFEASINQDCLFYYPEGDAPNVR